MAETTELDLYADDIGDEFSQENDDSDLFDDVLTSNTRSRTGAANAANGARADPAASEEANLNGNSNQSHNSNSSAPLKTGAYELSTSNNNNNSLSNANSNISNNTGGGSGTSNSFHSNRKPSVYVGNLTWWTTDQDVIKAFNQVNINDVHDVKFFENRANGQSKGYCIVQFYNESSIKAAIDKLPSVTIHDQTPMVGHCNRQNLTNFEMKSRKPGDRPDTRQNGQMGMGQGGGGLLGNQFMPPNRGGGGAFLANNAGPMAPQLMGLGGAGGRPPLIQQHPQLRPQTPLLNAQPQLTPSGGGAGAVGGSQRSAQFGAGGGTNAGGGGGGQWPQLLPNGARGGNGGGGSAPPGAINLNMLRLGNAGPAQLSGGRAAFANTAPLLSGPGVDARNQLSALSAHLSGQNQLPPHLTQQMLQQTLFGGSGAGGDQFGGRLGNVYGGGGGPGGAGGLHSSHHSSQHGQGGDYGPRDMNLSEADYEEIVNKNKTLTNNTVSRATADTASGDYQGAIDTLNTAISLIKESRVSNDPRCKSFILSLEDTLHAVQNKEYARSRESGGGGGRNRASSRDRSRDRDRDRGGSSRRSDRGSDREKTRARERSRSRERDYRSDRHYDDRGGGGGGYDSDRYRDKDRHANDRDRERDRRSEHRSRH